MVIKFALLGLAVLTVYDVVRGILRRRGRYHLKRNVNDLRFIATLIVVMFLLMGVVQLAAPIAEWAELQSVLYAENSDTSFVISLAPFVWVGVGMWVSVWLFYSSFKPIWKYSEEEEVWRKEGKDKFRGQVRKVLPFIKWKEE